MKLLPALAGLFLAVSTTAWDDDGGKGSVELRGACEYGAEAQRLADGSNVFLFCDAATIEQDGVLSFFDNGDRRVRYMGDFDGSKMAIRELQLRDQPVKSARGTCTIYRREGRISTITCVGVVRNITYATNFVPK